VRAREVEERMTDGERFLLVIGVMGQIASFAPVRDERIPEGTPMSAAYTPGVPRLGVPGLRMSDASMGVTNPGYAGLEGDTATAMPACIALGASFNLALARASGRAIGLEARPAPPLARHLHCLQQPGQLQHRGRLQQALQASWHQPSIPRVGSSMRHCLAINVSSRARLRR
jgi:hypothetical protein